MINWDRLDAHDWRSEFHAAQPFPHVVIDGAFDDAALDAVLAAWPASDNAGWKQYQKGKRAHDQPTLTEPQVAQLMRTGCNKRLILWLRALCGIDDLNGDDRLQGGGLHEVESGGSLGMHVDFNRSGAMFRRLNLILFLNRDWRQEWGGAIELRDAPKNPTQTIIVPPLFNRLVIFEASEHSWHGHPKPLDCPENVSRKSLAWYFYSHIAHASYRSDHSTVYVK